MQNDTTVPIAAASDEMIEAAAYRLVKQISQLQNQLNILEAELQRREQERAKNGAEKK